MWFDPLTAWMVTLLPNGIGILKDGFSKKVPAENWANKELYYQDMMNGMSPEERLRNVRNGRYKLVENHPEPHRDEKGRIIVENTLLYRSDLNKYGAVQAQKWMKQGKYNLTPEELEKERKRLDNEYQKSRDRITKTRK